VTDWQTAEQVAAQIHRNPCTVRKAARRGELHGHQTVFKGTWSFKPEAIDAYIQGFDDRAQREACGCARLRAVRRSA
jgi:hypothetical protein